ncbi:hypothetical protein MNBD_UNCLBAC01-204 [hydrothermal vent metagenome]|uniref:Uncharacterized protein n=1 Tax=hydrothermal vent metagenome TaxID=652676 RepID=A0A3B1DI47_9ZZZZ
MSNLQEKITQLNDDYDVLNQKYTTGNCWKLSTTLQELEGDLREYIQEITKSEIEKVISKLENNTILDAEDIDYIKLWIVGDADYYVKMENNYNDWIEEMKRIVGEMNKEDFFTLDFKASSKLRAMSLDGIRVLGDIMFFLKQKERIKNFSESTQKIDPQERNLLIRLLKGKISSAKE